MNCSYCGAQLNPTEVYETNRQESYIKHVEELKKMQITALEDMHNFGHYTTLNMILVELKRIADVMEKKENRNKQ